MLETNGEVRLDRLNEKHVLHKVKEEANILHTTERSKAHLIGHILRRNCLLKHFVEQKVDGRIEVTERRGITGKQLLDDRKVNRGYCKLKEIELARTLLRTLFGRDCGSVVTRAIE